MLEKQGTRPASILQTALDRQTQIRSILRHTQRSKYISTGPDCVKEQTGNNSTVYSTKEGEQRG